MLFQLPFYCITKENTITRASLNSCRLHGCIPFVLGMLAHWHTSISYALSAMAKLAARIISGRWSNCSWSITQQYRMQVRSLSKEAWCCMRSFIWLMVFVRGCNAHWITFWFLNVRRQRSESKPAYFLLCFTTNVFTTEFSQNFRYTSRCVFTGERCALKSQYLYLDCLCL